MTIPALQSEQRRSTAGPGICGLFALALCVAAQAQPVFRNGFEAEPACGTPVHFASGIAPTFEIHVAGNGNDDSGDGSIGNPYATPARALEDALPGAAVVIHAGTYAGGIFAAGLRGTAAAPIRIGGAAGEARPVIQGGSNGMQLSRPAYLVLHDIEVIGASSNGINIDDGGDYADPAAAHFVALERLDIRDIGSTGNQDCLKVSGLNDFWVLDSDFSNCGDGGSGIDFVGAHRGIVFGNRLSDTGSSGVQTKGGSEDIEIRANRLVDAGLRALNIGGSTGLEFFRPPLSTAVPNHEARDIRVFANLIVGGEHTPLAFVGCVECSAVNNTIVDPGRWLVRILQETTSQAGFVFEPARDGLLQNNLFYFRRANLASAEVNVGANTDAGSFVWRNNLFYAHDAPGQSQPTLPGDVSGSVVGAAPGIAGPEYMITASSPAAGTGLGHPTALGDLAGQCFLSPPSIGAWEVGD